MQRRPDWMSRLMNSVETAKLLPFQYGVHDCCLWAAHCVDAMCDTTLAKDIKERINYNSEESANAAIESAGGLLALVTEFLGKPERAVWAASGDVVLARDEGREIVGIVIGHSIIVPTKTGLMPLPYGDAVVCWRI